MCSIKAGEKKSSKHLLASVRTLDTFLVLNDDLSIFVKCVDLSSPLIFRRMLSYPSQNYNYDPSDYTVLNLCLLKTWF